MFIMASTNSNQESSSAFKRAQVRHKRQSSTPNRLDDLGEMIDFGRYSCSTPGNSSRDDMMIFPLSLPQNRIVKHDEIYMGPMFGLKGFPGFLYFPQALSTALQDELAYRAVSLYCEAPHITNIHSVPLKPNSEYHANEPMWQLWKKENCHAIVLPQQSALPNNRLGVGNGMNLRPYRSFSKLTWSTMGYHYDWTARAYNKDVFSHMPNELQQLSSLFAKISLALTESTALQYTASACIVNYYNEKSLMGGHRDDLELALDKPIVSISMGRPAVFLLGGATKDDLPVLPIVVRPGDVMVMGGASRLNYHGMARLLPNTLPPTPCHEHQISFESIGITACNALEKDRVALQHFLATHRININLRQAYPE